jgi:hypothetical protein
MNKILKVAAIAITLSGGAFASVNFANAAEVGISFNTGDVAYGYKDGYWDKSHAWHKWQHPSHRDAYRSAQGSQYHDWQHTRDADKGWHDSK